MDINQLIANNGACFYVIAFVWTFLEGETVVLFAGFAAAQGLVDPLLLLTVAWLGSFSGDQCYFWLGRRFGVRLLDRFRSIGPNGLASRKRGVPSNNQNHRCVRQLAMMLVRQHYGGVGVVYSMTALWSTVAGVAGFLSNSTRGMAMIDKIISSLKSSR